MTESRVCPQCRLRTDAAVCPDDGFSTVDAGKVLNPSERLVGKVFDARYRIEELVGMGGMGAVYRAVQLSVDRAVALKILRPEFASNLEQVRRFQIEARAASSLEHPNTIRVIDFGQSEDGDLYLVTELLEGQPLSTMLVRRGKVAPERVARIAVQALKSLSEAHARGIVHRDLKPENLFLKEVHGEEDFVKVLDFGIAKVATKTPSKSLTTTGTVVGTPLYMAPEQARGKPVDVRSDVYALGAVMYEMLSGEPPYTGDTAMAVMMAHIQQPLKPIHLGSSDPALAGLCDIVARCLEKDPEDRPQTADSLRAQLEDFIWDYDVEAVPNAQWSDPDLDLAMPTGEVDMNPPDGVPWDSTPKVRELHDTSTPASVTIEAASMAGLNPRRWPWVVGGLVAVGLVVALIASPSSKPAEPSDDAPAQTEAPAPEEPPTVAGAPPPVPEVVVAPIAARRAAEADVRQTRRVPSAAPAVVVRKPVRKPSRPASPRASPRSTPRPTLRVQKK